MKRLKNVSYVACSHWLSTGPGQGQGLRHGRMGCMIFCRIFYTAPEQRQGSEQRQGRMGYIPILQVLKLFQVVCFNDISMAFGYPDLVPDAASVNSFCIILVLILVPIPVPKSASVIVPIFPILFGSSWPPFYGQNSKYLVALQRKVHCTTVVSHTKIKRDMQPAS